MMDRLVELAAHARALAESDPLKTCDLDLLCARLGLRQRTVPLDVVDGYLTVNATSRTVVVNSRDSERRRRFTLAHEISHLLLGHIRHGEGFRDQAGFRTSPRLAERECDQLAVEILMPSVAFAARIQRCRPSISKILEMADTYEVSVEAAALRFAELTERPCVVGKWVKTPHHFVCRWARGGLRFEGWKGPIAPYDGRLGVGWAHYHDDVIRRRESVVIEGSRPGVTVEAKAFGRERFRYVLSVVEADEAAYGKRTKKRAAIRVRKESHGNPPRR